MTMPRDLVEEAAARAPHEIVLGARAAAQDLRLASGTSLLAAGGEPAPAAQPADAEDPVRSTARELAAAVTLADALPEVAVVAGPPLRALDVERGLRLLDGGRVTVRSTMKHVLLTTPGSAAEAEAVVAMAAALRDGEDERRGRPPFSLFAGPGAFAAAGVFAAAGLPVGVPPRPPRRRVRRSASTGGPDLTAASCRSSRAPWPPTPPCRRVAPGAAYFVPVRPALAGVAATGAAAQLFTLAAAQLAARAGLPAVARRAAHRRRDDRLGGLHGRLVRRARRPSLPACRLPAAQARSPAAASTRRLNSWPTRSSSPGRRRRTGHHRGRRDARPRRHQAGRHLWELPRTAPHAAAHEGRVAPPPARPLPVGGAGSRAAAGTRRTTRPRPRRRAAREARGGAARRRAQRPSCSGSSRPPVCNKLRTALNARPPGCAGGRRPRS